ncbi:MAG: Rne/Rng family ribonuclease [Gemmatimonadota bacterium]|nr:Rne/Rng family ribonuclease [Gemmatimonadota bacterium]
MQTEIFINQGIHESRIAILEEGRLAEVWVERPENERTVGDIYKGVVSAVLPGLQAAFVEIGQDRTAFLQVRDMMEADRDETDGVRNGRRSRHRGYPPIQNLIKKGEEVLVQITKEPIGTKGARVTTQLSLPGRFMVLVPGGDWVGVSRKIISRNERKRLRDLVFKIRPDGYSVIVRTEGQHQNDREFKRDMKQLVKNYERLIKTSRKVEAPALVYKEMGMTSSVIRDLFTDSVERLVVDSKELYKEITAYLRQVSPELRQRVEFYRDRRPIFDAFNIEEDIEKATNRTVWLRRGGALVIDYAEAGTFIDVNSARYLGSDDQEENNLNTNLKAAREIARQLKLRDIGGIIVIDFIDMNDERNRKKVVDCLVEEFKRDRAKVSISPHISEFGLVEMTRQRVRPNLLHTHSEPCPICSGTGRIMGPDTTLTWIERWLQRSYAATRERRYVLKVHPDVATYMLENREERLKSLRKATKARLQIETDFTLGPQDYRFFSTKRSLDVTAEFRV